MEETKIYQNRFRGKFTQRNLLWKQLIKYFFQKFISTNDVVLDLGCGYGEFINNIRCKKKIAVDINNNYKNNLNKNIQFIKSSSTNVKLKIKVDKVFISNLFEHLTREEIKSTIKSLNSLLKNDGEILVLQPNIRFCVGDYWMFFDHITPVDDRALEEAFVLYGFEVKFKILKFLPFSTKIKFPINPILIYLYLHLPILWQFFGQQSFLIFKKNEA